MKMKRIMALVMTSAMVMGTLAGCGASTDTTDATQSQSESSTAVTTTEAASGEKEWYGTEDGKTVTLQFWEVFSRNTDMMKLLKISIRNMRIRVYRWNITVMLTTQTETFSWRLI